MGHGRGQPDRLPLARPLARSLAHARGTGHPPGGKGTRYESHARGPTPGPASTRLAPPPHPTPPPPAQAGGRRRGWEAEGNTDGRRHGEARAGGHGDGRAGRGAAGKGAQRRPGRETPPAGGNARAAARRTGAGGGGGRQAREQREEKPGGRPPTARGPPCLPLSPSTQPHARVRPRRPTTDGWLEAGRPTPWSDTKTPRARGHEAPRGHSPGGSARRRKDTAASRGPPPGHASPGRGHARDTASGRAARPDRARRCLGGGAGRGRNPRRRGGPRQGAGRTPPPPPPPPRWGRAANGRRRRPGLDPPTDIARAPSRAARGLGPTPPPHPRRNTPCPKDRLRREEAPKGTAAAKANGLGASPLVRLFPLTGGARPPKASQPPPPAPSQPTPPSHTRSVKRAGGGGRAWGGVGCGADTAGGRGGAPVSALRGTKGTRRPCEDTPAAPPPERETPRGWRLIVKRRSDRRSPGRNPGPQVRSKCR